MNELSYKLFKAVLPCSELYINAERDSVWQNVSLWKFYIQRFTRRMIVQQSSNSNLTKVNSVHSLYLIFNKLTGYEIITNLDFDYLYLARAVARAVIGECHTFELPYIIQHALRKMDAYRNSQSVGSSGTNQWHRIFIVRPFWFHFIDERRFSIIRWYLPKTESNLISNRLLRTSSLSFHLLEQWC